MLLWRLFHGQRPCNRACLMFHFCLYAPSRLYLDRLLVRLVLSLCPLALLLVARDFAHAPAAIPDMILWAWPMMLVFGWFAPLPTTHVAPPKAAMARR